MWIFLLTRYFVIDIMTTMMSEKVSDSEVDELSEVYREMDWEGQKKMVNLAIHLLSIQKEKDLKDELIV